MLAVSESNARHPLREWLLGLEWDGEPRLHGWLHWWAGAEWTDDGLTEVYGTKWAISAVARILEPGCKVDTALILVGRQGLGKSTAFRTLAGAQWFSDSVIDVRSKEAYQALQGLWVYEWAELDSMKRSETTAVKAFLSARVDRYRPAYARHSVSAPRQCVFVGTTNDTRFLTDPTGSRRYWARQLVGEADVAQLAANREQIWSEAVARYQEGERWWLDRGQDALRVADAERHSQEDPWEATIARWAEAHAPGPVSIGDLLSDLGDIDHQGNVIRPPGLGIPRGQQQGYHSERAKKHLEALGWQEVRPRMPDGRRPRLWALAPVPVPGGAGP